MQDILTRLNSLKRPGLLIRAARAGGGKCNADARPAKSRRFDPRYGHGPFVDLFDRRVD